MRFHSKVVIALTLTSFVTFLSGCGGDETTTPPPDDPPPPVNLGERDDAGDKKILPPVAKEAAPNETGRVADVDAAPLFAKIESVISSTTTNRIYVQVDKPMYQPGETIWVKSWHAAMRELSSASTSASYQLVSPKGAVVEQRQVSLKNGRAHHQFDLPAGAQGGEYKIRVSDVVGATSEKPIIVNAYEAPRIKKKLEFVRKAYGAGDVVQATVEIKRPTGEPLANHPLKARIVLDGEELDDVTLTTDAAGAGVVSSKLPANIEVGDGILTVFIEDGGVTESVSKRVPIVTKKLKFTMYPEGGHPVKGIESRIYFEAQNPFGKPADVEGHVVDPVGNIVSKFSSHWGGLGRFTFTPSGDGQHHVVITKPVGISDRYTVPMPLDDGCVLRTFDDPDGTDDTVRARVSCTTDQRVTIAATQRDQVFAAAVLDVKASTPAVVHLAPKNPLQTRAIGVARITVFDAADAPIAERLVFRNRRAQLNVTVTPNKESYQPRDQVALTVKTTDASGQPVPAELALSVVDDTVVSFADDKSGHMISRLLLEAEIPSELEEPKFFFDLTEDKSALALEMLMGTKGWRKFDWVSSFAMASMRNATLESTVADGAAAFGGRKGAGAKKENRNARDEEGAAPADGDDFADRAPPMPDDKRVAMKPQAAVAVDAAMDAPKAAAPMKRPMGKAVENVVEKQAKDLGLDRLARAPEAAPPPPPVVAMEAKAERAMAEPMAKNKKRAPAFADDDMGGRADNGLAMEEMEMDADFAREAPGRGRRAASPPVQMVPVRVFPAPDYGGVEITGPRTDFRETIFWAPEVKTGRDGQGTITFYLSDAVTSFRVFAEGMSQTQMGRTEKVVKSSLPFSMAVKLPLEVSAGDKIQLPLIFTNERDTSLGVDLTTSFGTLLTMTSGPKSDGITLAGKARDSMFFELDVTGMSGVSEVRMSANATGLVDEFIRKIKVEPTGFPVETSFSGQVGAKAEHDVEMSSAEKGTASLVITAYPSPLSTMVSGLEGMLRQPHGCFEQASSSNYPNVMILQHLQKSNTAAPAIMERAQKFLEDGYQKLTGYESPKQGYEWFGGDPGHEALTAYGLLEFVDMADVYGVDKSMIDRTAQWIMKRKDGKGGYQRNDRALDSFGQASPAITNAYITYSLVEAGFGGDLDREITSTISEASSSNDAYLIALAANIAAKTKKSQASALMKKLAGLQDSDGAFRKADHSITRSMGVNLHVETTSLAVLAFLRSDAMTTPARKGVEWLMQNRQGFGNWGATQATILAIKAFTTYAEASRKANAPGSIIVLVNGKVGGRVNYEAGAKDAMTVTVDASLLKAGTNKIRLTHDGKGDLPYSGVLTYRTSKPPSAPDVLVEVTTKIEKTSMKMGDTVRATATIKNKTANGLPMTLVRVGLPGGLTFQTWQLKELREKGEVAFWETRPREVILYLRQMKPNEEKSIPIELVATVPGTYTGPASQAYLYYADDKRSWTDAFQVTIDP